MSTLSDFAIDILTTSNAIEKAEKTRKHAQTWKNLQDSAIGLAKIIPNRPHRPEKPKLLMPRDMPKRKKGNSDRNKVNLLHALAHIELNAIDLAWDIIARFSDLYEESNPKGFSLPIAFYKDWLKVADDEAKHFLMLSNRLNDFNAKYGDLPAHDGLWESAEKTAHDFAARLAIVPMVLEARGLDVTPNMITLMKGQNDEETASMLQVIMDDEVTHVRAGTAWFEKWCLYHDKDIEKHFQKLVRHYFNATLKRPFNHPKREDAGMIRDWYEPLADAELDIKNNA